MTIHLIRHGEVHNPHGFVYADISGFSLSEKGRLQAKAAGDHLSSEPPQLIVTSPLDRAVETAKIIAATTGADITTDDRLSEWGLGVRWRGALWTELPKAFPGELEAYLADPANLPFSPESIAQVAKRIHQSVDEFTADASGPIAFVSHEDPIHGTALRLTGEQPARFHAHKPTHCSITTLMPGTNQWSRAAYWEPKQ